MPAAASAEVVADVPALWAELISEVAAGARFAGLFGTARPGQLLLSAHLARPAGIATLEAAKGTGVRWALLFATHAANCDVNMSDQWERQKELMQMHPSQWSGDKLQMVWNMVDSVEADEGERIGVEHAVGFRCIRLR